MFFCHFQHEMDIKHHNKKRPKCSILAFLQGLKVCKGSDFSWNPHIFRKKFCIYIPYFIVLPSKSTKTTPTSWQSLTPLPSPLFPLTSDILHLTSYILHLTSYILLLTSYFLLHPSSLLLLTSPPRLGIGSVADVSTLGSEDDAVLRLLG